MNVQGIEFNTVNFLEEYSKIKIIESHLISANGQNKQAVQLRFDAVKLLEENLLFMTKNITLEIIMKRKALDELTEEMKTAGELK